jgi:DNA-binding response OmpR family regulator
MDAPATILISAQVFGRKPIVSALHSRGHVVYEATGVSDALALMNRGGVGALLIHWPLDEPVLCPIIDTIRSIGTFEHLACIVLSERRSSEDVLDAMEAGADDFVAWPVDAATLDHRVRAGFELTTRRRPQSGAQIKHLYRGT